jgi:YHS domain-containing protein
MNTTLYRCALFSLLLALGGCSAYFAQNPGNSLSPVNAVALPAHDRVMLKGADVVNYFKNGSYQQGLPEFSENLDGVAFYFASAENKAAFQQSPARYLPQYGGYCANGITYGIPWGGDADTFKIVNGKLYIFGGTFSKEAFELNEAKNIELADLYWEQEIKGRNSFIQRTKRLIFRVPHYQTGEDLAKALAAAKR